MGAAGVGGMGPRAVEALEEHLGFSGVSLWVVTPGEEEQKSVDGKEEESLSSDSFLTVILMTNMTLWLTSEMKQYLTPSGSWLMAHAGVPLAAVGG